MLGWVCFGPGPHKDGKDYYSPAMCERIVSNFQRLRGHTTPRAKMPQPAAKIGHDPEQAVAERLKKSLGFLSVGNVTAVRNVPGYPGYVEIDVRNVPTRAVGGEIAAGRINSGSVELIPGILDPDDPARRIDGPILTGVSFLGEEQPAVRNFPKELRARATPRATFDDGTPVPPNADVPPEWIEAMSAAHRSLMSALARPTVSVAGREYAASVICFSDLSPLPPARTKPMTPEQKAALAAKGLTPEQIADIEMIVGPAVPPPAAPTAMADPGAMPTSAATPSDGDMMAACMKYADDPKATPEQKMFAAMAKKFADVDELKKRFGAVEAKTEEAQKKDEAAKMAAFSAQVESALDAHKIRLRYEPKHVEASIKPEAMRLLTTATFADEADRVKTFSDYFAGLALKPEDARLASVATLKPNAGPARPSEALNALIGPGSLIEKQFGPGIRKRLNVA